MDNKLEMIEKLTGIRSSRKNYYVELGDTIEELQKKNKQLEVMNQLSRIHVNMSWEEVNRFIAIQLHQLLSFDFLILTLRERTSLSFFVSQARSEEGSTRSIHRPWREGMKLSLSELDDWLNQEFPCYRMTSVALQSHTDKAVGFLSILSQHPFSEEDIQFFKGIAEYAGIAIENIVLYKDVSEKVKIEAQLIQSAKLAAIGEMAAGVAHELNSPLTAILGNIQLLLRDPPNDRAKRMMEDIYQCGVRSKNIIQNLLTFSRQDEYRFEELDIHDLIHDVCNLISYQLKVAGMEIETRFSSSLPSIVGSRYQLEQIIINLLLNARDAIQTKQNPYISIETDLKESNEQTYVSISVYDNGSGIRSENMDKIFQPFFTTKDNKKGTGLGLSVSLGIAESHGGKIQVDSQEGEYSRFILLLPVPQDGEMKENDRIT